MPVQLPPVYLPSVTHLCEAERRRVVTLFHIEGKCMFVVLHTYIMWNFVSYTYMYICNTCMLYTLHIIICM